MLTNLRGLSLSMILSDQARSAQNFVSTFSNPHSGKPSSEAYTDQYGVCVACLYFWN
jgi:hypothetical protein